MAGKQDTTWRLPLAAVRYRYKESLFTYPTLLMLTGVVLAVITTRLDDVLGHATDLPLTLSMSSNAAMWLLSTVAGAMITTVGVVFSLTVVSLQLASDQFSPRVMRTFIRDRLSQRVIGLLVATFVYCVLVLPNVSGEATDPAPQISVTVAMILTVITVVGILAHLNHLAHGLQVDIDHLFRSIPPGTTVRMETRLGAFIHSGEPLLRVWPAPGEGAPDLGRAVEISDCRAMLQDTDFAIRQLVDIGLRALDSDDPTTTIEITLRLGTLLRTVLTTPLAPEALQDDEDRTVVQPWNLSHGEYIDHAFDQLRLASGEQPEVIATLLRVLRMLIDYLHEEHADLIPTLERQSRLILESLPTDIHPEDLARLRALASNKSDPADHSC